MTGDLTTGEGIEAAVDVGDGASAFFLAETFGCGSPATRACIEAARAIRTRAAEVVVCAGEISLRFGLHGVLAALFPLRPAAGDRKGCP